MFANKFSKELEPYVDAIIECIPNISTGSNLPLLERIETAINSHAGAKILHIDRGINADRTVLTIAGLVPKVFEAIEILIQFCSEELNIKRYSGNHPCIGVIDVIPFVALSSIDPNELRPLVRDFCIHISSKFDLPIFWYGAGANSPEKKALSGIRRGGRKKLTERLLNKSISVDFGPNELHHTLGGSNVTVRELMVAFNIDLTTKDLKVAKQIAHHIRQLRDDSDFYQKNKPKFITQEALYDLKILGWYVNEYNCCQISTNLYDIHAISILEVVRLVRQVARIYNCEAISSELIGLAPIESFNHQKSSVEAIATAQRIGLRKEENHRYEDRLLEIQLSRITDSKTS